MGNQLGTAIGYSHPLRDLPALFFSEKHDYSHIIIGYIIDIHYRGGIYMVVDKINDIQAECLWKLIEKNGLSNTLMHRYATEDELQKRKEVLRSIAESIKKMNRQDVCSTKKCRTDEITRIMQRHNVQMFMPNEK